MPKTNDNQLVFTHLEALSEITALRDQRAELLGVLRDLEDLASRKCLDVSEEGRRLLLKARAALTAAEKLTSQGSAS